MEVSGMNRGHQSCLPASSPMKPLLFIANHVHDAHTDTKLVAWRRQAGAVEARESRHDVLSPSLTPFSLSYPLLSPLTSSMSSTNSPPSFHLYQIARAITTTSSLRIA
jgi:hypothetical protein